MGEFINFEYSSRFDLFHTVVDGKNWAPAEYARNEEGIAAVKRQAEIDNIGNSNSFVASVDVKGK